MNSGEALAWLYGVQPIGIKLGLENTHRLLETLGVDTSSCTVWHVAGTNGKGSVCAFLESVLRTAGRRTGLFTSPHLVRFAERIRVGFEPVEMDRLSQGILRLRELVQGWEPHPTFFELTTGLALRIFLDEGIEDLVLETGMGGRLDATNAVRSDVAIVTSIGLDHQKWLGDTLGAIAGEKAGIFKPGVPAVVPANLPAEAMEVIRSHAAAQGSPLTVVEKPLPADWSLGLRGAHQRWNAALAVAALRILRPDLDESVVRRGLAEASWPARFQIFRGADRTVVVDGAHNPAAAEVLAETWREEFGKQKPVLIFGTVGDKDARSMFVILRQLASRVIFTSVPTQRGRNGSELAADLGMEPGDEVIEDPASALDREKSGLVLVAGSLYLAGKALACLEEGEGNAAFEASLQ
ncbi:MAG: dihydrofolate synthase / folylpolyglutamate synthase [Verrucomicrobia bacterium]|nr:MAG: dihydrofolate synthase / folylpolyglutamate synthase [Verrucomicrobiota bacterium]